MKRNTVLAVVLSVFASAAFAQMPPPPDGGGEGGFRHQRGGDRPRDGRFGGGPGMMMKDFRAEAEAELAKKYPEEYAKLVKARSEAENGMQELAKKAGIALPEADFVRREKMAAFQKKYEVELKEINELRKTDPRGAMRKYFELLKKEGIEFGRPGGMRNDRGNPHEGGVDAQAPARMSIRERLEQMVKKELPDDYKQYEELRKEDPQAADNKLRELAKKAREQQKEK